MNWIFNRLMLLGAGLGCCIVFAVFDIADTADHKGPGTIYYGDENGGEGHERVSEREFKRHRYAIDGIMLTLGVVFWVAFAKDAAVKRP